MSGPLQPRQGWRNRRVVGFGMAAVCTALLLAGASAAERQEPPGVASPPRVRLLTQEQYDNVIAHLFGRDVVPNVRFAPLPRTNGLVALGATEVGVTASAVQQFRLAAGNVAAKVVDPVHRGYLIPCAPRNENAADPSCARQFFMPVGRVLFRHTLTESELKALVTRAGEAADRVKDFYGGLATVLTGMLYDPQFLYVVDAAQPDRAHRGLARLTDQALATRLSLFLWNAPPDARLLDAAERGQLRTPTSRARVVDEMMKSTRFADGVRAFFDDMFGLSNVAKLSKDPLTYPAFTDAAARDAREQALRMIVHHLVTENRDYRDLFTTRSTFLTPDLAVLYQAPAPAHGWIPYELPKDDPRAGGGLLTQIGFVAVNAHSGRSSPTMRGRAIRELVMCQRVPDPPPNVDFTAFDDPKTPLKTARERLEAHRANPVCAGCHRITDPIGLALENFDGAGQFRTTENGVPIDSSGSVDTSKFASVAGFGQALRNSPALSSCVVSRVYAYAVGSRGNRVMQQYLEGRFMDSGYRVPALMRVIATSDAFATVAPDPTRHGSAAQK